MSSTTEELVAAVSPKIGALGSAFYFIPETLAAGKELGLDGFRFYVVGRGGVLGRTNPAVVHSAFGYFNADLVENMWNSATEIVEPEQAAVAYYGACAALGRAKLSELNLAAFCTAAEQVVGAADGAGLTLFAATRALPLPEDLPARAMQLVAVLREFRGSAHLAAVRAAGLDSKVAHFANRPQMAEVFGYPADAPATVTDTDRSAVALAEQLTDRIVLAAYATLDDNGRQALREGIDAIEAALAA